jgi:hypothetical protein
MKTLIMVALAVTITTSAVGRDRYFSDAQRHRSVDLTLVSKRFVDCLRSGNEGVLKSALAHATWMKLMVPERSFPALENEINGLVVAGVTPEVRYRASLATLVFQRPAIFVGEEGKDFEDGDDMFASIARRVNYSMLEHGKN